MTEWALVVCHRDDLTEPLFAFGPLEDGADTAAQTAQIHQRLHPDEYVVLVAPLWPAADLVEACDEIVGAS